MMMVVVVVRQWWRWRRYVSVELGRCVRGSQPGNVTRWQVLRGGNSRRY